MAKKCGWGFIDYTHRDLRAFGDCGFKRAKGALDDFLSVQFTRIYTRISHFNHNRFLIPRHPLPQMCGTMHRGNHFFISLIIFCMIRTYSRYAGMNRFAES